jgi:hypothetical protein
MAWIPIPGTGGVERGAGRSLPPLTSVERTHPGGRPRWNIDAMGYDLAEEGTSRADTTGISLCNTDRTLWHRRRGRRPSADGGGNGNDDQGERLDSWRIPFPNVRGFM